MDKPPIAEGNPYGEKCDRYIKSDSPNRYEAYEEGKEAQRDADYHWAITNYRLQHFLWAITNYRKEVLKEAGVWLNGDCPHRTMANLDGEGDISLRHRSECPECLEALESGTMPPNKS